MKLITIALLSAALLAGCSEAPKYLITYECQTKDGQIIHGTTVKQMDKLTERQLAILLAELSTNPRFGSNGIVVLGIFKLD
jgi:hypothetical protein